MSLSPYSAPTERPAMAPSLSVADATDSEELASDFAAATETAGTAAEDATERTDPSARLEKGANTRSSDDMLCAAGKKWKGDVEVYGDGRTRVGFFSESLCK